MSNSYGPAESLAADQLRAELGIHVGQWSISSDEGAELQIGDGPMASLSCKQAVKLAHVLLTIAAGAGIAKQVSVGEKWWTAPDPGPDKTVWLFNADLLT